MEEKDTDGRATADKVRARLLAAGGEPVSGQRIADELGVSRNAVWKAVQTLRRDGWVIDAERKAGYRLAIAPDPIDVQRVLAAVETDLFPFLHYVEVTDSTNDEAKAAAKAGAPEGTIIVADNQRRGRGRRGRPWEGAPGQSLLLSIVLRPDIAPPRAPLLVFLAAGAVREALQPWGRTWIKWPNDVVDEHGRKLCGILVELDAEHDRVHHVVVGIGLNVRQRPRDFGSAVRERAASASMLASRPVSRNDVLIRLLNGLARRYDEALRDGFAGVLEETRRHSATLGRPVVVHEAAGGDWTGVARQVQADGSLLVRRDDDGADVPVVAGEVSIRMEENINANE